MDTAQLHRRISDLTSALGDPTRRAIYIALREANEPLTTSTVSNLFSIHPNVARHHLEKLSAEGYLRVEENPPGGRSDQGAGRPAKRYSVTSKAIRLNFPERHTDLLIGLLVKLVSLTAPEDVADIAERVGREYGEELAAEIGSPDDQDYPAAIRAVAHAMGGLGFGMDADVAQQRLLTTTCPFGDWAAGYPDVICSLDRGIVSGLFASLEPDCNPVLYPHVDPDLCITEVPAQQNSVSTPVKVAAPLPAGV